ncbi:MAG TPA: LLM class flavin-dependent oxidoreductase [Paracoccus sp. (in: a-proteobacteria)]|nr:LLM class flavin-dependent oxidoreductase [Paracoccus sp. (in: a-proteobacteria)]
MTSFSAIAVGNESLLRHCVQRMLDRGHRIAAVVTRDPDLRAWAESQSLRVEDQDAPLSADAPQADWLFSIANLSVLRPAMLARGTRGAINFHDGPLPDMAGLNVPVWAIAQGHDGHGISWHLIGGGIDEGDLLVTRDILLSPRETALTLNARCYAAAADSFESVLDGIETGNLQRRPQDLEGREYYPRDRRPAACGLIDLRRSAAQTDALVRALDHGHYWNPLTVARLMLADGPAVVTSAEPMPGQGEPGQVLESGEAGLVVATGDGAIRLVLDGVDAGDLPAAGTQLPQIDEAQRQRLTELGTVAARHDAWWRKRLAQAIPAQLHNAGGGTGAGMGQRRLELAPDRALAASAWALARLDGRPSVDIAVRPKDLPSEPGIVADWLPLRVQADGDATLADLAAQADSALAEVTARQFHLTDLPRRAPELRDQAPPRLGIDLAGGGTGLDLWVAAGDGGWTLHWNRAAVPDTLAKMAGAAIERAAAAPDRTALADLSMVDANARRAMVVDRNDTARPVPAGCIHDLIAATLARDPDAPALVFEDRTVTRAGLDRAASALALRLQALGVGPDRPVGLFARRGIEMVVGALAILKAGGAYLPLDPDYPSERLSLYLSDSGADIVLVQRGLTGALPACDATLVPIPADIPPAVTAMPAPAADPSNLAYLIYTSGSTGRPKGVMIEHRNVTNFFAGIDEAIPVQDGDCLLAVTSLSFDISVLEIFWSLARGLKVVIAGEDSRLIAAGAHAPADGMEFSLFYWGNDDGPGEQKYRLLLEGARFADQNGFAAVWTPERHFHAFGGPYPNPSVSGAAVAAVTSRIGVRAGSCVLPLHHPVRVAEEWAVIDNLTGGRAGLAVASGWQPEDFVLRPENIPPANKQALSDGIDQLRRLWRGEAVAFPTASGRMQDVVTQPRPVQPELPLWMTIAGNPDTWVEAGRKGMNVLTHLLGQSIDVVADRIRDYHAALRESGHDPRDFTVTLMLHSYLADTREAAHEAARGPMKSYLRSAAGLVKQFAWDFPAFRRPAGMTNPMAIDLGTLTEEEVDGILEFAFRRYFEESGLFGTVEDGVARVARLAEIGVTEVACLIDYGIAPDQVLAALPLLAELRDRVNAGGGAPAEDDFSIAAQIRRHGVTHLQCTPSMARILVGDRAATRALRGLRCLMIGGEALPDSLLAELRAATGADIFNMYGPTETTIWSSAGRIAPEDRSATLAGGFANTQLYVLDATGAPVPDGVEGELYIGGHGVARGYWQRPDLTEKAFVPDPFVAQDRAAPGGARMYRTGDLVRWRDDGRLDYVGRADHQVKLRGFRIELGEIETRLMAIPGVREAVTIVREDRPGDQRLVAYVTGPAVPSESDLRAALMRDLPAHMVPGRIVTLAQMPLTPNRKIDRNALPAPENAVAARPVAKAEPAPAVAPVAARAPAPVAPGALFADIRSVWSETLGIAAPKASDNFFALGGHSLLAIQLHRTLRDRLGADRLGVTDIFRFPVLRDYVDHAESLMPKAPISFAGPAAAAARPAAAEPLPANAAAPAAEIDDPIAKRRALREQFRRGL